MQVVAGRHSSPLRARASPAPPARGGAHRCGRTGTGPAHESRRDRLQGIGHAACEQASTSERHVPSSHLGSPCPASAAQAGPSRAGEIEERGHTWTEAGKWAGEGMNTFNYTPALHAAQSSIGTASGPEQRREGAKHTPGGEKEGPSAGTNRPPALPLPHSAAPPCATRGSRARSASPPLPWRYLFFCFFQQKEVGCFASSGAAANLHRIPGLT